MTGGCRHSNQKMPWCRRTHCTSERKTRKADDSHLAIVPWLIDVIVVVVAEFGVAGVGTASGTLRRWPGWSRQLGSIPFRSSSCSCLFAVLASVTTGVRASHTRSRVFRALQQHTYTQYKGTYSGKGSKVSVSEIPQVAGDILDVVDVTTLDPIHPENLKVALANLQDSPGARCCKTM